MLLSRMSSLPEVNEWLLGFNRLSIQASGGLDFWRRKEESKINRSLNLNQEAEPFCLIVCFCLNLF
mgnify:FL=1